MVNPVDSLGLGFDVPKAAREGDLGQEDFLHLMLTQLKNQDPFKPMESGEFLGQLAQFGTVQGLAGLQTSFDSLASSLVSNQALQASSLVGRSALAATSTLGIAAGQRSRRRRRSAGERRAPSAWRFATRRADRPHAPARRAAGRARAVRVGRAAPTTVPRLQPVATRSTPLTSRGPSRWSPTR